MWERSGTGGTRFKKRKNRWGYFLFFYLLVRVEILGGGGVREQLLGTQREGGAYADE